MILAASASPSPDPDAFVVTNGSNRCGSSSSGTPGPLSLTQNSSGSETRVLLPGSCNRTPGRKAVVRWISPSLAVSNRLGGILDEVEENLDELIAIGKHWRQGRIVLLDKLDVARKTGMGKTLYVFEHQMDVDWLARDRPFIA